MAYGEVAEFQTRGLIHYHAIIRLDHSEDRTSAPEVAVSAAELVVAIREAAGRARLTGDGGDAKDVELRFGEQLHSPPRRCSPRGRATPRAAWAEVMERHDELPPVAIIVGRSGHRGGGLILGHFAAERWKRAGSDDVYVHELMIGGEGLRRGAAEVFATLLHEAAHALASVRGIQGTSRQGRYHNKRFKQLGAELGLVIEREPRIGWSLTTLPPETAERYAAAIETLDRAIALHRRNEPTAAGDGRSGNLLAAACQCPRRIRVAPRTLADGPIVCTVCAHAFEPVKP